MQDTLADVTQCVCVSCWLAGLFQIVQFQVAGLASDDNDFEVHPAKKTCSITLGKPVFSPNS